MMSGHDGSDCQNNNDLEFNNMEAREYKLIDKTWISFFSDSLYQNLARVFGPKMGLDKKWSKVSTEP